MAHKKSWIRAGRIAFWLSWPLLFWYLGLSRRTRILVISGSKILVTKRWLGDGKWSLPGGGVHRGESVVKSVLRELKEETGLTLKRQDIQKLYTAWYHQNGLSFRYHCYAAELSQTLPVRPQRFELIETRWLSMNGLDKQNANDDVVQALDAWSKQSH